MPAGTFSVRHQEKVSPFQQTGSPLSAETMSQIGFRRASPSAHILTRSCTSDPHILTRSSTSGYTQHRLPAAHLRQEFRRGSLPRWVLGFLARLLGGQGSRGSILTSHRPRRDLHVLNPSGALSQIGHCPQRLLSVQHQEIASPLQETASPLTADKSHKWLQEIASPFQETACPLTAKTSLRSASGHSFSIPGDRFSICPQ